MASYRDRRYPEHLRFPGDLRPKILIGVGLFVNACCLGLTVGMAGAWWWRVVEGAVELGVSVLYLWWWPREIVSMSTGLRQAGWLWKKETRIGWKEMKEAEEGWELGGARAAELGLRTDTLVMRGADGAEIVHTPRHPDRERLVRDMKQSAAQLKRSAPGE